jgi:hypothetical protein
MHGTLDVLIGNWEILFKFCQKKINERVMSVSGNEFKQLRANCSSCIVILECVESMRVFGVVPRSG